MEFNEFNVRKFVDLTNDLCSELKVYNKFKLNFKWDDLVVYLPARARYEADKMFVVNRDDYYHSHYHWYIYTNTENPDSDAYLTEQLVEYFEELADTYKNLTYYFDDMRTIISFKPMQNYVWIMFEISTNVIEKSRILCTALEWDKIEGPNIKGTVDNMTWDITISRR